MWKSVAVLALVATAQAQWDGTVDASGPSSAERRQEVRSPPLSPPAPDLSLCRRTVRNQTISPKTLTLSTFLLSIHLLRCHMQRSAGPVRAFHLDGVPGQRDRDAPGGGECMLALSLEC